MKIAVDLFCGAGGMSEGILQAGFHIVFSSDKSSEVALTYTNRHEQLGLIQGKNTHFEQMDIRELTGDFIKEKVSNLEIFKDSDRMNKKNPIDVIFGGPPCQGFSRSGKRDPKDPRNFLFREYLRVIDELKPRYVVMENVEGMVDMRLYIDGLRGAVYENEVVPEILKKEFNAIGYNTLEPKILDASDYGVPQSRRRIIFIAYLKGEKEPKYPEPIYNDNEKVTVIDAIGDLIKDDNLRCKLNPHPTKYQIESKRGRTKDLSGNYVNSNDQLLNYEFSNHTGIIVDRFSLYREGEDANALKKRISLEGIDIKGRDKLISEVQNKVAKLACNTDIEISPELSLIIDDIVFDKNNLIEILKKPGCPKELIDIMLTKKNNRKKLDRNKPSLTVVTLPDDYISPFEDRIFSVREMARLQSFDDSFEFLGKRTTGGERRKMEVPQYTQVGNAVPPLLAKAIATKIMEVLK